MQEIAYAKINLALHVRRRREDGYHMLETLFAFAEDGDRLKLGGGDALSLHLSGPFAAGLSSDDNLVTRAAKAFFTCFGITPTGAIRLDKRLPVASGIGGGSADAAAALRLLALAYKVPLDHPRLVEIATGLGADVPACLASRAVRGEERGDRLTPVAAGRLTGMPLLLVNPGVPLSTAEVFRGWDGVDRGPLDDGDPIASARAGRNDLEAPAVALQPVIGDVLGLLRGQPGTSLVRMSGSGATCFALFESEAGRDAADSAIAESRPSWWRLATRLR